MRKEDILKLPSMPASGPSYPAGPYRFIHREFMVITYETDPDIVRDQLPEMLAAKRLQVDLRDLSARGLDRIELPPQRMSFANFVVTIGANQHKVLQIRPRQNLLY